VKFGIEPLFDAAGNKFWILFEHGMFHAPAAVIEDSNMRAIIEAIVGKSATAENIGARVKSFRRANRYTQQQMADLSGVSRNRLSAIENGKANLTAETMHKLQMAMI
jgi:DNA-binding XRE family transcriptional regulator